jgi:hypothetical protein
VGRLRSFGRGRGAPVGHGGQSDALHLRLLVDLLRRPRSAAGVAMPVAGFLLQAVALANGPVQPVVAAELAASTPPSAGGGGESTE